MDIENIVRSGKMEFQGIDDTFFLLGLMSAFDNRHQAKADSFFE